MAHTPRDAGIFRILADLKNAKPGSLLAMARDKLNELSIETENLSKENSLMRQILEVRLEELFEQHMEYCTIYALLNHEDAGVSIWDDMRDKIPVDGEEETDGE